MHRFSRHRPSPAMGVALNDAGSDTTIVDRQLLAPHLAAGPIGQNPARAFEKPEPLLF